MKKILLFCFLFLFIFSVSYANQLSADCKQSILSNLQKLYDQNVLNQTCYNAMVTKVNNFGTSGHVYTRYALIIGQGNINSYQGVLDTNRAIYIALSDASHSQFINYPVETTNQIYNSWQVQSNGSGYKSLISGLLSTGSNPGGNQWQFNQLQSDLYCYAYNININTRTVTLGSGEEVGGNYLLDHPPVFTPSDSNGYVSVTSNGVTVSLPRLTFSYTGQRYYTLGYLSNYKNNDEFYNLEGNFGPYVSDDIIDGSMSTFHFDYENGSLNGSLAFNYTTGEISILATKLIDLQTYNLSLQYSSYNGQYQEIGSYDYYATYYTTHVTSGELISPDLNSTVDIGFVNALDDFFDYNNVNSGDLDYMLNANIFNFSTSGDVLSGDLFSGDLFNKLGFFGKTNNKYDLFIYRIYKNILNVLGSNTDYSITISYRNFTKTLHGSDFYVPSGPLKTFISIFLLGGIVILFYQQLHYIYITLITLDIFGFLKNTEHEHSFFL